MRQAIEIRPAAKGQQIDPIIFNNFDRGNLLFRFSPLFIITWQLTQQNIRRKQPNYSKASLIVQCSTALGEGLHKLLLFKIKEQTKWHRNTLTTTGHMQGSTCMF